MDEQIIQRSKTVNIGSDNINLKEIERKDHEEEKLKEKKAADRQKMMEKQNAAETKKQAYDDAVLEYNSIVDKMNAKAEVLKKAGKLFGDSFAMEMVKNKLKALNDIRNRKDIPEEEKHERIYIAMYDLEAVCVRYRYARYKDREPQNTRHKIVDSILQDAASYIDKSIKREPDTSICYEKNRRKLKELLRLGDFDKIKSGFEAVEKLLSDEISLDEVEFDKQKEALIKGYREVIEQMNEYVEDTSRITSSSKNKYRIISDALLQMNLEYNKIFGMSSGKLGSEFKEGYTWENIINTRGRIITPIDVKKKNNMIVNAGESDAKMTALYSALGSDLCLNYETAEKVGKNKKGGVVRKKVSVAESRGKYLTKAEILSLAAGKKAEVNYTKDVVFGLTKIQMIDMIAGVKNRRDDSLCFKYRELMKKGRKVFEIYDVKVMFTKGGFTGENADEYNNNRTGNFERIYKEGNSEEERVMSLWAYDYDFADKIRAMDPAKIIEALNRLGVKMDVEEKDALIDRLEVLQDTLDIDREYGLRSRIQPIETIPGFPTSVQNKAGTDALYKTVLFYADETFTLLDKKLLAEGHIKKNKTESGNKKDEELSENELFVKKANSVHKKQSISGMKRKSAKRSLAHDASVRISSYSTNPSSEMQDIKNLIIKYTNINATASDIDATLRSEKDESIFKNEMSRLNDNMVDIGDLFDQDAEKDSPEENSPEENSFEENSLEEDSVSDSSEPLEEPKAERIRVAEGLQHIHDERKALVDIVYKLRTLKDDLISGKLNRTEKEKKKELLCIEQLEELFEFTKGNLEVPEGAQTISDEDIAFIDVNKNKNKEVELTMVDMSPVPLFEHEPCIEDVKQGDLGDCYFLAAIASIVENNPEDIKNMMRDNGDTVTVRLYDSKCMPKYLTVKKTIPMDAKNKWSETFAKGAYWVQYLEKAYTLMNPYNRVNGRNQRNYENIAGGHGSDALRALIGKGIDVVSMESTFSQFWNNKDAADYTDEEIRAKFGKYIDKALRFIREKKRLKLPMTAGTRLMQLSEDGGLNGEQVGNGIVATHEYTVLGVEKVRGRDMIKLRNPWGNGAMHYEIQEGSDLIVTRWRDDTENGAFYITPERFVAYFRCISGVKMERLY